MFSLHKGSNAEGCTEMKARKPARFPAALQSPLFKFLRDGIFP